MKHCTQCQHVRISKVCAAAAGRMDIITGQPFLCSQPLEVIRLSDAYCGVVGAWFVKRETEQNNEE